MVEKRTAKPAADRSAEASDAEPKVNADVQKNMDVETDQGFRGIEVDPTPNENYTLAGQNAGLPTPETDDATAEKARQAATEVQQKAAGVAER